MNRQFIFARTAKGELAIRTVNGMQPDEKRVLLLIDGVSNIEMLGKKFPPSLQRQLDNIVTGLLKSGYIEEFAAGSKQFEGKLNKQLIFVRTAKGEVAMRTPGRIASDEKRVMLLIDGMTSIEILSKKLPPSLLGQLDEIIVSLFKASYIEEQSTRRNVPQSNSRLDYRVERAEFQDAIDTNEQISSNLLALAESEISQRIDLEKQLQNTQRNLIAAERQLAEIHLQYGKLEEKLLHRIEELEAELAGKSGAAKSLSSHPIPAPQIESTKVEKLVVSPKVVQNEPLPITDNQTATLPLASPNVGEIGDRSHFAEIRQLTFFRGFSDAELDQLLSISEFRHVPAETTLITENKPNQIFYVLVSGKVRRVKNSHTIDFLHVGDCFGEVAYLKGATLVPFESVITRTECVLLTLNPTAFNGAQPTLRLRIAQRFMRVQSQRMNETLTNLLI